MSATIEPMTEALRHALLSCDAAVAAELRFLEQWELHPTPGLAAARRIGQLRRAHPVLAAAIRAEIASVGRRASQLAAQARLGGATAP